MFIQALNRNLNLQRFKVIYVCGNYSSILSSLDPRIEALDVRRAFTVFQLMTVLEENRHTIVIIEHDPLLYEDAQEMAEYVSQTMREASKDSAVLLYAQGADPCFEELVKNADRVFYFDDGPKAEARVVAKAIPRTQRSQMMLEAFSQSSDMVRKADVCINIMVKQMIEKLFRIISKGKPTVPMLAHIPHGSTFIPHDIRRSLLLSDENLKKELILMTDSYTPEIFAGIAASGGLALVNNFSRLVVDPERFESDEKEKMSSKGMGAIYTRTACQQMLRREISAKERDELLSTYFRPYHKALRKEVQRMLDQFERCLIIDCHSFPSKPLPYEFDQSTDRPDICIGTNPFHTPQGLIALIWSFCEANGVKAAIDRPFGGTYVPLMYLDKDKRVSSIMIEVNRSLYMDEETGDRSSQFSQTKGMIDSLIKEIIDFEASSKDE